MPETLTEAFGILTSKLKDVDIRQKTSTRQRRNGEMDDFDKEYSAIGENGVDATIYLSISPDMGYIARWEFKIIVVPFAMPVASGDSALSPTSLSVNPIDVTVNSESLTVSGDSVSPNPHSHTASASTPTITPNPHSHSVNAGVTLTPSTFGNIEIWIDGVDFTSYFMAQFDGWIDGEGMFPDTSMENRYDILKALNSMSDTDRSSFLKSGYHTVTFKGDGLFSLKLREFKKYSHIIRQGDSTSSTDTATFDLEVYDPETPRTTNLETLKHALYETLTIETPQLQTKAQRTVWNMQRTSEEARLRELIKHETYKEKVSEIEYERKRK